MRRIAVTSLLAVAALAVLPLASASAASENAVLLDCRDNGSIDRSYSQAEYRHAIETLPADAAEYTDCVDQIRAAQLAAAGPKDGSGSLGSKSIGGTNRGANVISARRAAAMSPRKVAALAKAKEAGAQETVAVGNETIRPGMIGSGPDGSNRDLPVAVIALLIAFGICVLAGGTLAVSNLISRRG